MFCDGERQKVLRHIRAEDGKRDMLRIKLRSVLQDEEEESVLLESVSVL